MKKVDFLFIYEIRARELENICLLKYELERRGYTVELINTWYYLNRKPPNIKAKVVLAFALYNDEVFRFIGKYTKKVKKLINMQWEQIGTVSDDSMVDSHFLVSGRACNASHICWGEMTRDRLVNKVGIDNKKLFLTGHISLDFFRKELVGYYKTREDLFREYNIPLDKKVCLFISSFSYVEIPKTLLDINFDMGYDLMEYVRISIDSQAKILNWFTSIISKNSNIVFVYRPHPAEAHNQKLYDISNQYSNFYVINSYSVKQWILACDLIYNWYSTSLAEIYAGGKGCHILRPLPLPLEMELSICTEADFITDYDAFEATLDNKVPGFPISDEIISYNYYIDPEEPAYKKVCDKIIEVYHNDYYLLPKEKEQITMYRRIKRFYIKKIYRRVIAVLGRYTNINHPIINKYRQKIDNDYEAYCADLAARNNASKEEIMEIINRIEKTLLQGKVSS